MVQDLVCLGSPVWSQELGSPALVGLFQLKVFYDAVLTELEYPAAHAQNSLGASIGFHLLLQSGTPPT